jgi:hypothetical protein
MDIYFNTTFTSIHPDATTLVFAIGLGLPTEPGEWVLCTTTESVARIERSYNHLYTCAGMRYYGKL